jgi:hypothetical protein
MRDFAVTPGIYAVSQERYRQITAERFSSEHDDVYRHQELVRAAICYLIQYIVDVANVNIANSIENIISFVWPWNPLWWKPKDPLRNLVRGLALGVAELDRLLRESNREAKARPLYEVTAEGEKSLVHEKSQVIETEFGKRYIIILPDGYDEATAKNLQEKLNEWQKSSKTFGVFPFGGKLYEVNPDKNPLD